MTTTVIQGVYVHTIRLELVVVRAHLAKYFEGRMKLHLTFVFFVFSCLSSYAQSSKKSTGFEIVGKLIGREKGELILNYLNEDSVSIKDTFYLDGGNFHFTGRIKAPTRAVIYGNNKSFRISDPNISDFIFLEPRRMQIVLRENKYKHPMVRGSKTQKEYNELKKRKKDVLSKVSVLEKESLRLKDKLNTGVDTSITLKQLKELKKEYEPLQKIMNNIDIEFIEEFPSSFVSIDLLLTLFSTKELSKDSTQLLYSNLFPILHESVNGRELDRLIALSGKSQRANIAPEIKYTDLNNNEGNLSSFRGKKTILLEFWASWCKPCLEIAPRIRELFREYKDREDFEIISISIDRDSIAWKNSIRDFNNGEWTNIFDTGQKCMKSYDIYSIPTLILIGKDGKIIDRYIGDKEFSRSFEDLENDIRSLYN